jgi:hypothetical protein
MQVLAAMHGFASRSSVPHYPTWKHSPRKERNEQGCYNAIQTARCLQLDCDHYVSLSLTNRKSSVHLHALYSPHCTKDVYTPQGSTRDLWTVHTFSFVHTSLSAVSRSALFFFFLERINSAKWGIPVHIFVSYTYHTFWAQLFKNREFRLKRKLTAITYYCTQLTVESRLSSLLYHCSFLFRKTCAGTNMQVLCSFSNITLHGNSLLLFANIEQCVSYQDSAEQGNNAPTGNKMSGHRKCWSVTSAHRATKHMELQPCRLQAMRQKCQRYMASRLQSYIFRRFVREWVHIQWLCVRFKRNDLCNSMLLNYMFENQELYY